MGAVLAEVQEMPDFVTKQIEIRSASGSRRSSGKKAGGSTSVASTRIAKAAGLHRSVCNVDDVGTTGHSFDHRQPSKSRMASAIR
jgi:hypothetical protein